MAQLTYAWSPPAADTDKLSRAISWLLIALSCGIAFARIVTCHSPDPNRPVPFMSANDRSRWCTVRALVDDGTYAIDRVITGENGAWWDTIDKVRHAGPDGRMHFYSSKPVLWPTWLAAQYWVIQKITGWNIQDELFAVVRLILAVNNLFCLALFVWAVSRIVERISSQVATRSFVTAAAAFGTFLTPFAITLNNHLPAAALVAWTTLIVFRLNARPAAWGVFFVLGVAAAFAASLELPATSWLAVCGVAALMRSWRKTLTGFIPGAGLVAGSMLFLNFQAHGDWRTPYAHRGDGEIRGTVSGDFEESLNRGVLPRDLFESIHSDPASVLLELDPQGPVTPRTSGMNAPTARQWIVYEDQPGQYLIEQGNTPNEFHVRRWDNWYDYPGSYWRSDNRRKSLVDQGENQQGKYLLHMTVGHHGILSLTPIFLLSLLGVFSLCRSPQTDVQRWALAGLAITGVVLAFYVTRPAIDRNYGGMTSGLRWVFWLYPFWLAWMIPVVERASRVRWAWWGACLLLFLSTASAQYAADNPWVHPWLYAWMAFNGWDV